MVFAGVAITLTGLTIHVLGTAPTDIRLARQIDRACGLEDRLTTACFLRPDDLQTAAAGAFARQLEEWTDRMDLVTAIPITPPRWWQLLILGPTVLVLAIYFQPPPRAFDSSQESASGSVTEKIPEVDLTRFKKHNIERRQFVAQTKAQDFAEIQAALDRLERSAETVKDKAQLQKVIEEITRASEKIGQRQDALRGQSEQRRLLQQAAERARESAQKTSNLQQALASGQFDKARQALKDSQQRLKDPGLQEQERKNIENELKHLAEEIEKLTDFDSKEKELADKPLDPEVRQQELARLEEQKKKTATLRKWSQSIAGSDSGSSFAEALDDLDELLEAYNAGVTEAKHLVQAIEDLDELREGFG
ncbi:MAG: hypothetical protein C4297_10045 [Gemmataceae bacterium]